MKFVGVSDLEALAFGATVLGSGGGGDPAYDVLLAKHALERYGPVALQDVATLDDNALVVPLAFMGAPLVMMEKLPSGNEFEYILDAIESHVGRKVTHVMPAEIGGGNALTPFPVAAKRGLSVLDADTIGRAFPELQMSSCHLHGIQPTPAFIADSFGNVSLCREGTAEDVETFFRQKTIEMGSSAAIALYLMTGKQAKSAVVAGSITRALQMKEINSARVIASGMIDDIEQAIDKGFLNGSFTLDSKYRVYYQNEYLAVYQDHRRIVATPDIIVAMEQESGMPITSESLCYGLRVDLLQLEAPEIWKTTKGLKLVGPEYFGLKS